MAPDWEEPKALNHGVFALQFVDGSLRYTLWREMI